MPDKSVSENILAVDSIKWSGTARLDSVLNNHVQLTAVSTVDYCGNIVYDRGRTVIQNSIGYVTFNGGTPVYHYYLRDHLGNNRVVVNGDGTVEQVNHYYPYGGVFGESSGGSVQPYRYNGKELDRTHGLDWYDYGARMFDAAAVVWRTQDPLSEKYYNISPYVYCADNPVNNVDINGDSIYYNIPIIEHGTITGYTRYTYGKYGNSYGFGRNGELYTGSNITIAEITKALNKISNGGQFGFYLISELSGKTDKDTIIKYGKNETRYNEKESNDIVVSWNPEETKCGIDINGNSRAPAYISLAHELYHANDFLTNGNYNAGVWFFSENRATSYKEMQACRYENLIRAENDLPLRKYYANYRGTNIPYPPSLIINFRCFNSLINSKIK